MNSWNLEQIRAAFDQFLGESDPSDPKEQKKTRIVEAASGLFEQYGFRKTSIDEVARRAGVAKGTVYLYFKTKADLMVHAIVAEKKKYILEAADVFDEPDPVVRLQKWIQAVFVMAAKMPITSRLLQGDHELQAVMSEMDPNQQDQSDALAHAFLKALLTEAIAPSTWPKAFLDDAIHVLGALGYFAGDSLDERVRGGLSLERFAAVFSHLLVHGIVSGDPATSEKGGLL